jgi:hypothetical protein
MNTGGALNAANLTSSTVIEVVEGSSSYAIVTNLVDGMTIKTNVTDDVETATIDTAANASVTLNMLSQSTGTFTFTDAVGVTVTGVDAAAAVSTNALALDTADTTSLTVVGADTANALNTGNVTGTAALTSLSLTSSTALGATEIGTVADMSAVTSMVLTGVAGNVTTGALGAGTSADVLATVTANATSGSLIAVGAITADDTDSAVDNAMTLTISADSTSEVNTGVIVNTYGTINATVSSANTTATEETTVASLVADDVTATLSGAGDTTITLITATDDATVTASGSGVYTLTEVDAGGDVVVNGAGVTGTLSVTLDAVTGTSTVTSGAGAATITSATGGDTSITLGAANGAVDQIITHGTSTSDVSITNFETSATGDAVDLSVTGINTGATVTSLINLDDVGDVLATSDTVVLNTITAGAYALSGATADSNILVLNADFALTSMVETALEINGTFALTTNGTTTSGDGFLVAWDDGSNSYLGTFSEANAIVSTTFSTAAALDVVLTFVGVADVTDLTAANYGTALIA